MWNTVLFVINARGCGIFQKGAFITGEIFSTNITKKWEFLCQKLNKVDINTGF